MDLNTLKMYYVTARNATIIGENDAEAIENLYKLYKYVENLFERGSIVEKIQSKQLYQTLSNVMASIKLNGLRDQSVLDFFAIRLPKPVEKPVTPTAPSAEASTPSTPVEGGDDNIFDILTPDEAEAPIDVAPPQDGGADAPSAECGVPNAESGSPDGQDGGAGAPNVPAESDEADIPAIEVPDIGGADDGADAPNAESGSPDGQDDGAGAPSAEGGMPNAECDEGDDPNRIKAPEMLDDFIGQADIVKRLKKEIAVAKKRGIKYLSNILLFGNRGLGKTTLMKIIANELGVKFEWIDASQFQSSHTSEKQFLAFLQNISMEKEPVVIGIDEIHALPKKIQSSLLTLLQSRVFVYMDNSGHNHNIPIEAFTFIGATTDPQDVLDTIQDRCKNLTFTLKDYTHDELKLIFQRKFASKKLQITDELIEECIQRCRCSIREVEAIVLGLLTEADFLDTHTVTKEMLDEYFTVRGIDDIGLESTDIDILRAIVSTPTGVISADTLASKVGLDVKVLLSKFEPYLIKIGFVTIINRGRAITDLGRAHLKKIDDGDSGADAPSAEVAEVIPEAPIDVAPPQESDGADAPNAECGVPNAESGSPDGQDDGAGAPSAESAEVEMPSVIGEFGNDGSDDDADAPSDTDDADDADDTDDAPSDTDDTDDAPSDTPSSKPSATDAYAEYIKRLKK